MSKTLEQELQRLTDRVIELGYIKAGDTLKTEVNSFGSTWVTIPNIHGKNSLTIFTILNNEEKTEYKAFPGKFGR